MTFTAIHKYLGLTSGPVTDELVDSAVAAQLQEDFDLDWKRDLPPTKDLKTHDFPKDVAAMANSGGGTIVYGIAEKDGCATGRKGVGNFPETHQATLLRAAVTNISPPVFGIKFHHIGEPGKEVVVMVVPPSVDGPHLIYKDNYFGAPIRNGAFTIWMLESQIEAAYRARFDERRHSNEALENLYQQNAAGKPAGEKAWLITIAHPRVPRSGERISREQARKIWARSEKTTFDFSKRGPAHPFESIDWLNPRTGLRRWVVTPNENVRGHWKEAWMEIHHDGSVALATSMGGSKNGMETFALGHEISAARVESSMSDFFAVLRETAKALGINEYEIKAGIEWDGNEPLQFETSDAEAGIARPISIFSPVTTTVQAGLSHEEILGQARTFVEDFLNQGGIAELQNFHQPANS